MLLSFFISPNLISNHPKYNQNSSISLASSTHLKLATSSQGLPRRLSGRESANAGDMGSIPGLGRSLGEENGNLLQYSYLGDPMDRGAWQATVPRVTKESDMT